MTEFIFEQLNKVKHAKLPYYTKDTTDLYIPQSKEVIRETGVALIVGDRFVIEVADYILHPYEGFNLHDNWNNGIAPTEKRLCGLLDKVQGKMYHFICKGWAGWLPRASFSVLERQSNLYN